MLPVAIFRSDPALALLVVSQLFPGPSVALRSFGSGLPSTTCRRAARLAPAALSLDLLRHGYSNNGRRRQLPLAFRPRSPERGEGTVGSRLKKRELPA